MDNRLACSIYDGYSCSTSDFLRLLPYPWPFLYTYFISIEQVCVTVIGLLYMWESGDKLTAFLISALDEHES
jgi:hypothetical protein